MKIKKALIFTLPFTLFWALLFLKYISIVGLPEGGPLVFSCVYALGHAAEFALVALLMMLVLSALPAIIHSFLCAGIDILITVYLLTDYIIYTQFRLHINMAMLDMFFSSSAGDIFVFTPVMWAQAACAVAVICVAAFCLYRLAGFLVRKKLCATPLKIFMFFVLSFAGYHGAHAWASFNNYSKITYQMSILPLSYPLSVNSFLRDLGITAPLPQVELFEAKLMRYPLAPVILKNPRPLNIVVIMLDGWRADTMTEDITPNIWRFSRRALRFQKHISGANHTRHGVFSFFYGLPGAYWVSALNDQIGPVLMTALIQEKYAFAVYAGASLTKPEFHKTVFADVRGMDYFTKGASVTDRDRAITDKFSAFLDSRDSRQPFFSFLFYDSTHSYDFDQLVYPPKFTPYESKNYLNIDGGKREEYFNQYKNSVGYCDVLVGRVLDRLKDKNLLDETIVIITSDHGEEFDDNGMGYWGHNGNYSGAQTHVPMIVYWPGKEPEEYTHLTSHHDVALTLMQNVFNCVTDPVEYTVGANLFTPGRDYIYIHGASDDYALATDEYITVFSSFGEIKTFAFSDYAPLERKFYPEQYRHILQQLTRFKK
jgi:membrane-anchored protein YejM (alkaline phosphatase superfamily)